MVPLLLIAGCSLYIDGPWVDNAPARAAAVVSWAEPQGPLYPAGNTGVAYWGWFQAPQDGFGTDWVLPAPVGCSDKTVDLTTWTDALVDLPGDPSVIASKDTSVPMTWVSANRLYDATLVDGDIGTSATTFNLQGTNLATAGTLSVAPFVEVPGEIPYYGPDPGNADDTTPPALGLDQLLVTWSGDAADVVAVTGSLLNSRGTALETWTCAADGADGQVQIPKNSWQDANVSSAKYVSFAITQIVYTNTAIGGMEAVSRGVGERTHYAAYTIQ